MIQPAQRKHNAGILLLFWVLLFPFPLHAQKKGYREGYVVTQERDTLRGWVKDRSPEPFTDLHKKIRFKAEDSWFRKRYGPDDILAYGYGDQHFESHPLREESAFFRFRYVRDESSDRVFLKVVERYGPLTYYHWEYVDGESSYVDFVPLFHKNSHPEMVRVTQGILGLKRNRLAEYFRECPELVWAIEEKRVNEIMEVYHFFIDHCLDHLPVGN